jgi:hypothetical protein
VGKLGRGEGRKEYRISNKEYPMSKGKKKKNEEGKKKNEYRMSKDGAPKVRFLFTAIDHDAAPIIRHQ